MFGIKAHFSHLPRLVRLEPHLLRYRFITLERRDLVKQAVSYAWAAQTGSWISDMNASRPAVYDWGLIARKLHEIGDGNAGWNRFLAGIGVTPCRLIFEDVRADVPAAIAAIAAFIGADVKAAPARDQFFPREQREQQKLDWVERFTRDSRERLQRGDLGEPPRPVRSR